MKIHLVSEGIDDWVTIGGPDADVTVDEALGHIPPVALDDLIPGILETGNPVVRLMKMYHGVLSYVDDHRLWQADTVTFTVDLITGSWSVDVDAEPEPDR